MLMNLKVRTGMSVVLSLFVLSLLLASLSGWYGASVSDKQIETLNLLTAQQLDRLNNAAILLTRASASTHVTAIDRHSGRATSADVEKGLKTSVERVSGARKLLNDVVEGFKEPSLLTAAKTLEQAFEAYAQAVTRQIEVARSGTLLEYAKGHDGTRASSVAYASTRDALTTQISQQAEQIMQDSDRRILRAKLSAIGLVALALLLAAGCWWFISQHVLRPLRDAGEHFRMMAEGDLGQRIEAHGRNEIGELFSALIHMQRSQRETLSQLNQTAVLLASSAETLDGVTRQSTAGLQQQHAELEQAATAVTEMTTAIEEVARNALSTSETASASNQLAQSSRNQVGKTLREIEVMSDEVQNTGQVIQRLADQARDIGKVLDVIRSVSEQTNLLALNAAIEAARAGEAGRGFAVVADEVRTLASRTQQSTLEIEQMISSIQSSSDSAVNVIQLSNKRALGTLDTTRTTGQMLEDMFGAISQINERNQVIANAAEGQAQVAREVDRNLLNIRELAAESSAGARETSQASEALSRLAVQVKQIVARFRL